MKKPIRGLIWREDTSTWSIDVMVNGQRIRKSLGIPRECLKEAEEIMHLFWLEVGKGNIGLAAKNPPLAKLFDNYIDFKRPNISDAWHALLCYFFERVQTELGVEYLADFKPAVYFNWLSNMKTMNTAMKIQKTVYAAFQHALNLDMIDGNPVKRLPKIKHRYKVKEPLTLEEFTVFAEATQAYSCGYLLRFLMKTGCRVSEARLVTWRRLNLEEGILTLRAEDTKTRRS